LRGSRLALARLLTQVENDTLEGRAALIELFPHTGKAHLVGVTGAPGTGKSSLVNQLARFYRNPPQGVEKVKIGIVAVDPSSPFSGGAILGDRVRMRDLSGDPGVYIRSMASRGALGGIAASTAGVVQALDAAGYELILIETVGAGQDEVEIARLAHTTIVVEAPGLGDDIQAIKAGILEIADILVVNKADRPGVENTERGLKNMLQLARPTSKIAGVGKPGHEAMTASGEGNLLTQERIWSPPIIRTVATEGEGVEELADEIQRHREYMKASGAWIKREQMRLQAEMDTLLNATVVARWHAAMDTQIYQETLRRVLERQLSPREAVLKLVNGDSR
jgi:LAO/AO transport system kinase